MFHNSFIEDSSGKIKALFTLLIERYGLQGWWPIFDDNLPDINRTGRHSYTKYHPGDYSYPKDDFQRDQILIASILAQNTSWVNADKSLKNLLDNKVLSLEHILNRDQENIAKIIRSSGYFNQKARKLKNLAEFIVENPYPKLIQQNVEDLREQLLKINGIGPETADSIILYGLNKTIFVVDVYTRRFLYRLGFFESFPDYHSCQTLFHQIYKQEELSTQIFNEFHALIVQHCVHVCKKNPICNECFLKPKCAKKIEIQQKIRKNDGNPIMNRQK